MTILSELAIISKRLSKPFPFVQTISMATINDVAKKAGVSITTVSYVLTGKRFVSEDLQKRVRNAMKEVGYRPNKLARSLRVGKTDTIGLIIPDSSNLFFAEFSRHIEDIGFANHYTVILCNSDDNPVKQNEYLDVLITKQVDGIIFTSVNNAKSDIQILFDANIPFVIVDRDDGMNADTVLVDNFAGGYEAASYLISLGHTKIACITGPSAVNPSANRYKGFLKALDENGIRIPNDYVKSGDFRYMSGEQAMTKLLNLPDPPTAVFVCNDMMAIGAIRAIQLANLKVPNDISVIGFDNIPISDAISPALTTIAQPINEIAEKAMSILFSRMQGEAVSSFERVILKTKLVVRDSTSAYIKVINV